MHSKRLPGWAQAACTAAAALVFLLVYEWAVYKVPVTQIFLPTSSWSDEVIYSKQLAAAVRYGAPQGYFGFNESHAEVGTYAAWGPAVFFDTDTEASDGEKKLPEEMIYLETGYAKTEGDINFLRLIRKLPEDQREVVYLKYAQELSFREIAEILGIPARTVQSRLRIALKKLRKKEGKPDV